jgi:hypothetical protein
LFIAHKSSAGGTNPACCFISSSFQGLLLLYMLSYNMPHS